MANWNLEASAGVPGTSVLWRGPWNVTLSYNIRDAVMASNGSCYLAITNNQGKDPISNPADWDMLVSVGAQGPQGIQGPKGDLGGPTPVGAVMDYAGANAPSGWLLCFGQAISRVTYVMLFNSIGLVYGSGDGTSTFNVPDCRGRVLAGDDNMGGTAANRLTIAGSGIDGQTLGASGGLETTSLAIADLPSHTHAGVDHLHPVTGVDHTHSMQNHQHLLSHLPNRNVNGNFGLAQINCNIPCGVGFNGSVIIEYANAMWSGGPNVGTTAGADRSLATSTGAADRSLTSGATGSGTAHRNIQPTIVFNKIIYAGI